MLQTKREYNRDCTGKNNNNYGNRYAKKFYCEDCDKEKSRIGLRCGSCAKIGEKNPSYNEFCSIYYCIEENCDNIVGKVNKKCQSCSKKGELNPNWIDGRNNFLYPHEFNDKLKYEIRNRDNFECQLCELTEEEHVLMYSCVLHIHHIDYDKQNCEKSNLITLCNHCNCRVNFNRKYWEEKLKKQVIDKCYKL